MENTRKVLNIIVTIISIIVTISSIPQTTKKHKQQKSSLDSAKS